MLRGTGETAGRHARLQPEGVEMQVDGMGAVGYCICLRCNHREPHQPGQPCRTRKCPQCGAVMIREDSEHHRAFLRKQQARDGEPPERA